MTRKVYDTERFTDHSYDKKSNQLRNLITNASL